jgi:hypothetical protein
MSENKSSPLHSVESIIAAIKALPIRERKRLIRHLGYKHEWLLGYVMARADTIDFWGGIVQQVINHALEADVKVSRSRRCEATKRNILPQRHAKIDQLIDQGFSTDNDGEKIYKHILEHHPDLLKIKRSKRGKRYVGPKSMWKMYQASKRK